MNIEVIVFGEYEDTVKSGTVTYIDPYLQRFELENEEEYEWMHLNKK